MSRAVLSIGSNMGDRVQNLQSVLDAFGASVVDVSPIYTTAPWGGIDQDDFLNAILVVDDPAVDCLGWLHRGQQLEQAAARTRTVVWGPRTLDVDVVTCDDIRSDDPELTLPHPRAHERAFVLVPWIDVEPDGVLDVGGVATPLTQLLAALPDDERTGVAATELVLQLRRRAQ